MTPATDLHARLRRLRAPVPLTAEAERHADLDALMQRIARLRGQARAHKRPAAQRELDPRALGAHFVDEHLLETQRCYAFPFEHGAVRLQSARTLRRSARLALGTQSDEGPRQLLLLDTETSGLAGGSGTLAFQVGMAQVRDDCIVVTQLMLTAFSAERALLARVLEAVEAADCVVTFNGKSFDVPLLKARTRLAGLTHRFDQRPHIDLLHVTRKRLREGWPDCRLRTAEAYALGHTRDDDLPGAQVPAAWQRWLRHRDAGALPKILDHNRDDLLSLAALLAVLDEPSSKEAPLFGRQRRPATLGRC